MRAVELRSKGLDQSSEEDDKKKLIEQLVDYEELKTENERLKKQLIKQE